MSEIQDQPADDTEGHQRKHFVDDGAELADETDDTEGHQRKQFIADGDDDADDTEGHQRKL